MKNHSNTSLSFRGRQCPNSILRGETDVQPGDTFIAPFEGNDGWAAMRYTPLLPDDSPQPAWKNFETLGRGGEMSAISIAKDAIKQLL